MNENKNLNISCDLQSGLCSPSASSKIQEIKIQQQKQVKVLYFTDPICSACWAIEPQLKKLSLEYGNYFDLEYKMGGLLPYWDTQSNLGGGMSTVSDIAHHWEEVSKFSGMSIDGDLWLEDPLNSSYPPSYAYLAMKNQGINLAQKFLRRIKEMLFLEKKNITRVKYLLEAVEFVSGDKKTFLKDFNDNQVKKELDDDLHLAGEMKISGFPTLIFMGRNSIAYKISGINNYDEFVKVLKKAYGDELKSEAINLGEYELLNKYHFLASKEISVILSKDESSVIKSLELLQEQGKIKRSKHKFGDFWRFV